MIWKILTQITLGLFHCHRRNEIKNGKAGNQESSSSSLKILHRDLKPGNILIFKKPNGKLMLKIADFGISKLDYMTIANGSS